ncbi:ABC-type transporter Mla subunit MlaD [Marinilabilia salmonicolor]|jgi:phospholipid/cholesterol/gamma-HCH transport system substrate-binding protein|uniref:ABC-type transporter Mla subunit MlaD n=2 Tax=Marinilabilia salmonicolor TaxID=989 RepID=A0A2T0XTC3_9BACT|nr:phospholipid/cholesterol/gamma-HCH transport system substrate-binding protein [Marinilabilia salmonicolor]RCW36133.1 ABC-type transporter Mla subunit MlaD [Marinilabilia salmonicolor]
MENRSKKIRLGIFILAGSAMFIFLIAFFTAREFFEKTDTYYVSFQDVSVSGMEVGSTVKYLGINVGTISNININPKDVTSIVVELSLKPGTPIKEDSKAEIVSLGITGMKAIEIRGGTNEANLLSPGSYIQPGSSLTSEITGKAEVIATKVENVLNNLLVITHPDTLSKLPRLLSNFNELTLDADRTILRLDSLIDNNQSDVESAIRNANKISENLLGSSIALDETLQKVNKLIDSDSIADIIGNTRDITRKLNESDITRLIEELAGVVARTQDLLIKVDDDINQGTRDFVESQELLKSTLRNLDEASRKINNNPSLLIRKNKQKNLPDEQLKN